MEDHFSEVIVPRKPRPQDAIFKVLLIIATVIAALIGLLISPIFLFVLVGLGLVDYSSGKPDAKPYAIIKGGTDSKKYLLELSDSMLEDLRWRLPGKVFRE